LAAELGIWLHIGSMVVRLSETKCANRAFVFDPTGATVATYDKIHMFDVEVASGERYRESKNYQAGNTANAVDLPWGKLGLAICYDMRFPALYRTLAEAGASILTVPSAFTVPTGRAHWEVLLRARAIETGCFVLAAAQCGRHSAVAGRERQTWGHSLAVAPWGEVLADGGETPGVTHVSLDLDAVADARARVPSLANARAFTLARAAGTVEAG
ncbi:MAG: carbon-nitrogen hydrolase family protein, partial [Pseudomonadota bacterium]